MIAFDSNVVIYAFEAHNEFARPAEKVLQRAAQGSVASTLIYSELLRKFEPANPLYSSTAEALGSLKGVLYLPVSIQIATLAANILQAAPKSLRLPDAIHLATASAGGAKEFWTNDKALAKVHVPGLKIKMLEQYSG